MADSKRSAAWQCIHRMARWWQWMWVGILVAWSLSYWPPVRSVVDQIANNHAMAVCVVFVLMVVSLMPRAILETIDHIRRLRQKNTAAASWRDRTSQ